MRKKRILALAMALSMIFSLPVNATEIDSAVQEESTEIQEENDSVTANTEEIESETELLNVAEQSDSEEEVVNGSEVDAIQEEKEDVNTASETESEVAITSASIAGVKTNGTIRMKVGTVNTFKISVNKGADVGDLEYASENVQLSDDSGEKTWLYMSGSELKICTGSKPETRVLVLKYNNKKLAQYKISIEASSKPAVETVYTTDTGASLKLSLASDYKYENIRYTSYYEISYIEYDKKDSAEATKNVEYVKVTGDSQIYNLNLLGDDVAEGNGYAKDFYVSVKYCNAPVRDSSGNITDFDNYSPEVGLKISTKNPYYETKLALIKKRTSIYTGEREVVIASAKFSKNTTYNSLSKVEILDSDGNAAQYIHASILKNTDVFLTQYCEHVKPGKYTIVAYAKEPDGAMDVTASMTFTVLDDVVDASISSQGDTVYKAESKPATVKTSLVCHNYSWGSIKPTDVKYSIVTDSEQIKSKVKVNSKGVVTIPKDYVVGQDTSDSFTVQAVVTGKNKLTYTVTTETITIKSEACDLGYITVGGYKSGETVSANQLFGTEIVVYDTNGNVVDEGSYTLVCSGCDADDNYFYITSKVSKCSITAIANDGSGKKITTSYKIVKSTGALSIKISGTTNREDTIDQSKKELTVANIETDLDIMIDGNWIVAGDSIKVTCKTGKLIPFFTCYANSYSNARDRALCNKYYKFEYIYCPKTSSDVITVTNTSLSSKDPNKSVSYSVVNTLFGDDDEGVVLDKKVYTPADYNKETNSCYTVENVKDYVQYYDANGVFTDLTIGISGMDTNATYTGMIAVDPVLYNQNVAKYAPYSTILREDNVCSPDGLIYITTDINVGQASPMNIGCITLNLYLTKTLDGVTTHLKPIPIKIKLKKLSPVSAKVASSVSIDSASGSVAKTLTTTVSNGTISYDTTVYNANINGTCNKFNEYFSISSDGVITAKKDLSDISASDLTGYIKYTIKDKLGNATQKAVKVTVKVNKK